MRHWPAIAVTVALLGGACGGGQSDEEAMVEAISVSILEDETFAGYGIAEQEATCMAESTVDGLGVARLSEIGFDADTSNDEEIDLSRLDDDEVEVIGRAMEDCIDDIGDVLVDTVAESILEDPEPTFPIDEDEAQCVAEAVIDQIPVSRLITIGVQTERADTQPELQPAEVDVFADAYTDCIDVRRILLDGIASSGTPDDVLACLDDNISDDDIDTIFRAGLAGDDTVATAQRILSPAVEACT